MSYEKIASCVVLKVKVTAKVEYFTEFSSGAYLLNCRTFSNQTWYGDASSWASEKVSLLFSWSRSQWGLIIKLTVSAISVELVSSFCSQISLDYTSSYSGVSCVRIGLLFECRGHSEGSNLVWIFVCLIFSVPLISWQLNWVCWCTITNKQTKNNKVGMFQ